MVKNIYVSCHGYLNNQFGFFVPSNLGKGVTINLYTTPNTTFINGLWNDYSNMFKEPSYKVSSGQFIFNIGVKHKYLTENFISETPFKEKIEYGSKKNTIKSARDRNIIFKGLTDEQIQNHPIYNEGYNLSDLIFDLELLYPGEVLNVYFISCLKLNNNFPCKQLYGIFNVNKDLGGITIMKYKLQGKEFIDSINKFLGNSKIEYTKDYNKCYTTYPFNVFNDDVSSIRSYTLDIDGVTGFDYIYIKKDKNKKLFDKIYSLRDKIKNTGGFNSIKNGTGVPILILYNSSKNIYSAVIPESI